MSGSEAKYRLLKKVFSILFLGILLFNWFGYRLLGYLLESNANVQLETRLDENDYDESRLVAVKIPITHLSYYHNTVEFERVDGKIEFGGVLYKYVKRRIYNDSLEVLCLPDEMAMKIRASNNDFFRTVNDLQHPGQAKRQGANAGNSRALFPDYCPGPDLSPSIRLRFIPPTRHSAAFPSLSSIYSPVPGKPPESGI